MNAKAVYRDDGLVKKLFSAGAGRFQTINRRRKGGLSVTTFEEVAVPECGKNR